MPLKEVDRLEITCLVDNYVDVLLPSMSGVRRPTITDKWFVHPLIAEHGFSAAVTIKTGDRVHNVLLDSGLDPIAAVNNAEVLGIDLSANELVISSHGHIDHTGGLVNIRKKMNPDKNVPLLVHSDAFKNRMVKLLDGSIIPLPAQKKGKLADAGYSIVERQSSSLVLDEGMIVTGEIPRTNIFEKGFQNHYSEHDSGRMENDPLIKDDQAVVINVRDKGLVVITGCGHAGIINTINYAKEITSHEKIYAVIGGMHLTGKAFEPIIPETIRELEKTKADFLVPCHCSGLKAITEIARKMPDAFVQNGVGTRYEFGRLG